MSRLVAVFARLCFACFLRGVSAWSPKLVIRESRGLRKAAWRSLWPLVSQSAALHRNRESSGFVGAMLRSRPVRLNIQGDGGEGVCRLCRRRALQAVAHNMGKNIGRREHTQALLRVVDSVFAALIRPSFMAFGALHRDAAMPPL